ncbi:hypothetical protein F5Y10DRAFT_232731 [Nemania abortiva]|nr:hypothetical protein F5Y10DRAFT_232731 [Nemania abortiva]
MINPDCLIHGVLQCVCGFGWMCDSLLHLVKPLISKSASALATLTCPSSWTMLKREQIRARFAIPGTPLNDCCISF